VPAGEAYDGVRQYVDHVTKQVAPENMEAFKQAAQDAGLQMAVQINGLDNSYYQAFSNSQAIANERNQLVMGVYNPTNGKVLDYIESGIQELTHVNTATVMAAQIGIEAAMNFNKDVYNQDTGTNGITTPVRGHSQGTIIGNVAVSSLTSDQQSNIDLVNLGTALGTVPANFHSYVGVDNIKDPIYSKVGMIAGLGGVQTSPGYTSAINAGRDYSVHEVNFVVTPARTALSDTNLADNPNHSLIYCFSDPAVRQVLGFTPQSSSRLLQVYGTQTSAPPPKHS
jgi:hypothetical protein